MTYSVQMAQLPEMTKLIQVIQLAEMTKLVLYCDPEVFSWRNNEHDNYVSLHFSTQLNM